MSQNLQNFAKFQKFQLDNLVDFEKCCKMHIFLQKSEPIQPKTSNILPKCCQPTLSDVPASERGCPKQQGASSGAERREVCEEKLDVDVVAVRLASQPAEQRLAAI